MVRIDKTNRTIFDDYIVRVDTIEEARHVVKKFKELGYEFMTSAQKFDCYYIAQNIIMDKDKVDAVGRSQFKAVSWGRSEVESSNEFHKMMTYDEFIKSLPPKIYTVEERLPCQKDLVMVESDGIMMPAIYYKSLGGFYHFSLYYHTNKENVYKKARTNPKWKIENVTKWYLMPEFS